MFEFFTAQYWQWATLVPQFLQGIEDGGSANHETHAAPALAFPIRLAVARKPLRRTLRYDKTRKHL